MKELRNSFPRIELAATLYSQASVKDRISQVYRQIMLFGREATNYFLAHSFRRVTKAIISPAPLAIDKVIEELKGSLAEVNAEIGICVTCLEETQRNIEIPHSVGKISQTRSLKL